MSNNKNITKEELFAAFRKISTFPQYASAKPFLRELVSILGGKLDPSQDKQEPPKPTIRGETANCSFCNTNSVTVEHYRDNKCPMMETIKLAYHSDKQLIQSDDIIALLEKAFTVDETAKKGANT